MNSFNNIHNFAIILNNFNCNMYSCFDNFFFFWVMWQYRCLWRHKCYRIVLNVSTSRGISRITPKSDMELFVTKVNGFQQLTFVTKVSISDLVVVLDTPLTSVRESFPKSQLVHIERMEDIPYDIQVIIWVCYVCSV